MNQAYLRFKNDYKGKKILILGLGLLGKGVGDARFFCEIGSQVRVSDLKTAQELKPSLDQLKGLPIAFTLGKHDKEDLDWADIVIRNPGVPIHSPFLLLAKKMGKPIFMDTALFCKYAQIRCIGITGTRGKSTTTMLSFELLKKAGFNVVLGGNIGNKATLPLLKKIKDKSWAVLELSSWQMEGLKTISFSPHIAIMTNIYPDHLNYYTSLNNYIADKKLIFAYQKEDDFLLLNKDDSCLQKLAKTNKSKAFFYEKSMVLNVKTKLIGKHNLENIAAVYVLSKILKIKKQIFLETVISFKALEYRLQSIALVNEVEFINDSTSTTPIATIKAVKSMIRPFYLILGGNNKNLPDKEMIKLALNKSKGVLLIKGNYTSTLAKKIKDLSYSHKIIGEFSNLDNLLKKAYNLAKPGEAILFSPGFTSFGLFKNEFDRAEKFNQAVKNLSKKHASKKKS